MSQPNVVLICCDDIGFNEIGVYQGRNMPDREAFGGERVHTPNIDSIARDGSLFMRYYATSPICTPSRYSILTGRFASRSPSIMEKYPPPAQATIQWDTHVCKTEGTIGKVFQSMGYSTGFVGKWHNGTPKLDYEGVKEKTDPRDPDVERKVKAAYEVGTAHIRDGLGFDYVERVYFGNKESLPAAYQFHNLEWIAEGARDFIAQSTEKPFFLYMPLSSPHGDHSDPLWATDPLRTPSGMLEKRPESGMPPRETLRERCKEAGVSEKTAMSLYQDDCVGAVLSKLEELGLSENTIVVFTCDHLARAKYMCYEGARVPFMIRWPGKIRNGMEMSRICANIDLVSTLTELAGGEVPGDYQTDGMSFAPLLTKPDEDTPWREQLLLEVSNIRAVVTDKWKYIANRASEEIVAKIAEDKEEAEATGRKRYMGWDGRRNPHKHYEKEGVRYFSAGILPHYYDPDQLYDLDADVLEQNNVVSDPKNADVVEDLKKRLKVELKKLPHSFAEFTSH